MKGLKLFLMRIVFAMLCTLLFVEVYAQDTEYHVFNQRGEELNHGDTIPVDMPFIRVEPAAGVTYRNVEVMLIVDGADAGTVRGTSKIRLNAFDRDPAPGNRLSVEIKRALTDDEDENGYDPEIKTFVFN